MHPRSRTAHAMVEFASEKEAKETEKKSEERGVIVSQDRGPAEENFFPHPIVERHEITECNITEINSPRKSAE